MCEVNLEKQEEAPFCKETYINHILETHTDRGVLMDASLRCEGASEVGRKQMLLAWYCWEIDKIRFALDAVLHENEIKRIRGNSYEERLAIAKANAIVARMANTRDTVCQVTAILRG